MGEDRVVWAGLVLWEVNQKVGLQRETGESGVTGK